MNEDFLKHIHEKLYKDKVDYNQFKSDFIGNETFIKHCFDKLGYEKKGITYNQFKQDLGIQPTIQESINDLKINLETSNYDLKKDGRPKIEAYFYDLINKHGDEQTVKIITQETCDYHVEYKFPGYHKKNYENYFYDSSIIALWLIIAFFVFRIFARLFSNAIQWSIRTLKDLQKQQDTTANHVSSKWRKTIVNLFDFSFVNWRKVLAREFLLNLVLLIALPILIMGFIVLYNYNTIIDVRRTANYIIEQPYENCHARFINRICFTNPAISRARAMDLEEKLEVPDLSIDKVERVAENPKELPAQNAEIAVNVNEQGVFINGVSLGQKPSVDDIGKLLKQKYRVIQNEDPQSFKEKWLTGEDSYHFYELGIFCEATHYFKTCTIIAFDMLTRINGLSVFNSNKMQLEIGGYNITEEFQHETLQADNAFKLVRQTDRIAVYKYANREIMFTYAHGDKNKLAFVMVHMN